MDEYRLYYAPGERVQYTPTYCSTIVHGDYTPELVMERLNQYLTVNGLKVLNSTHQTKIVLTKNDVILGVLALPCPKEAVEIVLGLTKPLPYSFNPKPTLEI